MKRFFVLLYLLLLIVGSATSQQVKYIFMFVGDGMGINHVLGTELYNAAVHPEMANGGRLSFTRFPVRTYCTSHAATSWVTDSSAAATAMATGVKTIKAYMGVDAEKRPVENVCELAKKQGMKVGIVSNVAMNHATPGAFYAHVESRSAYSEIFDQYIASGVDFAAGATILCRRREGVTVEACIEKARKAGICVTQDSREAAKVKGDRVLLLSDSLTRRTMRFATDRTPSEPTLVDFAEASIKYMTREASDSGFFLMIEGGHIDYAAHDNDAVTTFEEINDFGRSVDLALQFYAQHPDETLIVVTSDHETGGLTLGYSNYKMNLERLAHQKMSMGALTRRMQQMRTAGETSWADMERLLREELGFWDKVRLREKDEQQLKKTFDKNYLKDGELVVGLYASNEKMASVAIEILNKRAYVKWTSLNHTGAQVPLYAKGCRSAEFMECYDNADIGKVLKRIISKQD